MASEGLRISYRRSGGIAGIDLMTRCLAAELPEEQAQLASDLLVAPAGGEAPDGSRSGGVPPTRAAVTGADRFSYTVRLTMGSRGRTYHWTEDTVPDAARPLLEALGGLSQPSRSP